MMQKHVKQDGAVEIENLRHRPRDFAAVVFLSLADLVSSVKELMNLPKIEVAQGKNKDDLN